VLIPVPGNDPIAAEYLMETYLYRDLANGITHGKDNGDGGDEGSVENEVVMWNESQLVIDEFQKAQTLRGKLLRAARLMRLQVRLFTENFVFPMRSSFTP
jgi:hypothetical protein